MKIGQKIWISYQWPIFECFLFFCSDFRWSIKPWHAIPQYHSIYTCHGNRFAMDTNGSIHSEPFVFHHFLVFWRVLRGSPYGLKVPRPRLKHGSCDELSRIFLFFVSHPDEAERETSSLLHSISFLDFFQPDKVQGSSRKSFFGIIKTVRCTWERKIIPHNLLMLDLGILNCKFIIQPLVLEFFKSTTN